MSRLDLDDALIRSSRSAEYRKVISADVESRVALRLSRPTAHSMHMRGAGGL